jgi:methionyl-tRNA formyltransferase
MKLLKQINKALAYVVIIIIKIYQFTLSPDKSIFFLYLRWRVCAHHPHCSQYSINVLKRYGFWPGIFYAFDRVLHCTPSMTINYDPDHYKIVFFSSAPIWVPFLQELAKEKRFEVVGIVTQCDKPQGRGMEMCENIIKTEAKKIFPNQNEDFINTPTKLNPEKSLEGKEFYKRLTSKEPDFLVVIAYGKIIPENILDIAKIAPINVHGSILPKYRWASPIQSVFLNGEKSSGITIMKMDKGMDTWDMIDIKQTKLHFDRTCKDLIERMKIEWPVFLSDTVRKFGKKILGYKKQDDSKATYCSKIEKESWLIDPYKDSLEDIYNKYRAFFLRPKIYFMHEGKRIIIEELEVDEANYNQEKDEPLLNTQYSTSKTVKTLKVKPEWKKPMDRESFKNGYLK